MKKLHPILSSALFIILSSYAYGAASIPVQQIVVGPQAGDPARKFSLKIVFSNSESTLKEWQFGFYMPRNFRQTSQSNRKLEMQICQSGSKTCSPLIYQKAAFTAADLSTVFTTILAPQEKFPLQSGKSYTINLQHNSSRGPLNYSSLPQSLFLNSPQGFFRLTTSPKTYTVTNLDTAKTQQQIASHIQDTWSNSRPESVTLAVIPAPTQIQMTADSEGFILSSNLTIHDLSGESLGVTKLWSQALAQDHKIKTTIDNNSSTTGILLQQNNDTQLTNPEAYRLSITPLQIKVEASTPAGFFYALQTLRQLWFSEEAPLPALAIYDSPRFKYRGILLDVARHYLNPAQLKNFIDVMAAAKLNTLHLHLSDDEAFRVNLPDYPELATLGASRGLEQSIGPMAMIQKNLSKASDDLPSAKDSYTGSYSIAELQELIAYANLRQITIIPEIDIPGHSRALMKALPGAFYETGDSSEYAGYGDDVLPVCAFGSTSELGQRFTADLTTIAYQVTKIFNHQTTAYAVDNELSIGGDEVFSGTWDKAPSCQVSPWKNMNTRQKEHYFLDLFNNNADLNHIKLSGWHEFVINRDNKTKSSHGVAAQEVAHVWVWSSGGTARRQAVMLANEGYPVVMDYSDSLYFDMTYTPAFKEPGFYWATKFGDTYAALDSGAQASLTLSNTTQPQNILGLEGALWGDVIPDYTQLQYMAFPKLAGLAEAAWSTPSASGTPPNWQSLAHRLGCGQSGFLSYLHQTFNVTYRGYPNGISREAPQACQ